MQSGAGSGIKLDDHAFKDVACPDKRDDARQPSTAFSGVSRTAMCRRAWCLISPG
jgi:hypothetical protein